MCQNESTLKVVAFCKEQYLLHRLERSIAQGKQALSCKTARLNMIHRFLENCNFQISICVTLKSNSFAFNSGRVSACSSNLTFGRINQN